jgi:integrase/recombinase XerD
MPKACLYTREADTNMRHKYVMRRPTANRDQAIILVLVDTGLRALELWSLKVGDVEIKRGKVEVKHGVEGMAKDSKGRMVYLGKVARRALWRYLAEREDGEDPNAPLFTVTGDRQFKPDSLRLLIKRIAERYGVKNAYPHKFRHTLCDYISALGQRYLYTARNAWSWQPGYGASLCQGCPGRCGAGASQSQPGR